MWIQRLKCGKYIPLTPNLYEKIKSVGQLLLAQSNFEVPTGWNKVSIRLFGRHHDADVKRYVSIFMPLESGRHSFILFVCLSFIFYNFAFAYSLIIKAGMNSFT